MQFLKNSHPFIHKTKPWVYIEYSMYNYLWEYLPKSNMELIVKENRNKIIS